MSYKENHFIQVSMIEIECKHCGADFEVTPYFMPIEYKYDKGACESKAYYTFHCPYCTKKFLIRA